MPCLNAEPYLREAVASVLRQPECLELLVADGGSSDGSLSILQELATKDARLRIVSHADQGPADALNRAFYAVRGTLIGWLNADDLYNSGSFARATLALRQHPEWLMVYGEGMEFNATTDLLQRYPTSPPEVGIRGFLSHCFLCQPTVVFRRTMGLLLGPFDPHWRTAFDFDYWLRAFNAFPHRIGYIPQLQAFTRLHETTITSRQRSQVALEAVELLSRHFGRQPATRLSNYALEIQLGIAIPPQSKSFSEHLTELLALAGPWLEQQAMHDFRIQWLLDEATTPALLKEEHNAAALKLSTFLPARLLQALYPDLRLEAPGPPAGPHVRLLRAIHDHRDAFPLLRTVPITGVSAPKAFVAPRSSIMPFAQRPFGVNLIGHAFEVFGIGEDIRMAARALQSADVPCCVIHHPADNGSQSSDRTLETLYCSQPEGGPYAFNLVCMAAPIHARWLLQSGFDPLRERYTLASWPWETKQWPQAWNPLLEVADGLWPSSTFTAAALKEPAAIAGIPLEVIPMAAEVPDPDRFCTSSTRRNTRFRHNLPSEAILFSYMFDFNSTAIRKNPMGVLEAFQRAFPLPGLQAVLGKTNDSHELSPHVALLMKTFPPMSDCAEWQWLQMRAKEDPRIHIIVASLERDELLELYGSCDVFLSLHRSEGYGRGIAEALQLGLDVIASDYGGNTDFCDGPLAHLVRCREVPIPRGAYPCADGQRWGEPDLNHAEELMRQVAARRRRSAFAPEDPSRDPEVLATYRERFSVARAGERYKSKLKELWSQRKELDQKLKWKA